MAKPKNNPAPAAANAAAESEWDSGEALEQQAAADAVETAAPEVEEEVEYPTCVAKSFDLLREFQKMPTQTADQERAKAAKVTPLKAHIARLQQGSPIVHLGADDMVHAHKNHGADVKRKRLDILARENIEVRELLQAHDALLKEVETLRKTAK